MAITTRSSIRVNPARWRFVVGLAIVFIQYFGTAVLRRQPIHGAL
jgi:hypothetical protein